MRAPLSLHKQLLDADMPAERIAAFHTLIEALGTAGILHGFPPGSRRVRLRSAARLGRLGRVGWVASRRSGCSCMHGKTASVNLRTAAYMTGGSRQESREDLAPCLTVSHLPAISPLRMCAGAV